MGCRYFLVSFFDLWNRTHYHAFVPRFCDCVTMTAHTQYIILYGCMYIKKEKQVYSGTKNYIIFLVYLSYHYYHLLVQLTECYYFYDLTNHTATFCPLNKTC